jgi:hypothetical protein
VVRIPSLSAVCTSYLSKWTEQGLETQLGDLKIKCNTLYVHVFPLAASGDFWPFSHTEILIWRYFFAMSCASHTWIGWRLVHNYMQVALTSFREGKWKCDALCYWFIWLRCLFFVLSSKRDWTRYQCEQEGQKKRISIVLQQGPTLCFCLFCRGKGIVSKFNAQLQDVFWRTSVDTDPKVDPVL